MSNEHQAEQTPPDMAQRMAKYTLPLTDPEQKRVPPCPFCNTTPHSLFHDLEAVYAVYCRHCHAVGPAAGTRDDAVEYWTDRASTISGGFAT
jgi:hypothetical protein